MSAERVVAAARAAGDHRREAAALTDLGILIGTADVPTAEAVFAAATAAAGRTGDAILKSDVDGYHGLFLMTTARPAAGWPLLEGAVAAARAAGDVFAEKAALERSGTGWLAAGDAATALDCYARAIALARDAGDDRHAAELYWQTAIVYADLGRPDRAVAAGGAAVRLFRGLAHPDADRLAGHLDQYRTGGGVLPGPATLFGGAGVAAVAPAAPPPADPGVLRMAWTALKSAARFVGTGMRTVTPETRRVRLETCEACPHHTGTRCRLCGCFTGPKTLLPHESCPAGKWPRADAPA